MDSSNETVRNSLKRGAKDIKVLIGFALGFIVGFGLGHFC